MRVYSWALYSAPPICVCFYVSAVLCVFFHDQPKHLFRPFPAVSKETEDPRSMVIVYFRTESAKAPDTLLARVQSTAQTSAVGPLGTGPGSVYSSS